MTRLPYRHHESGRTGDDRPAFFVLQDTPLRLESQVGTQRLSRQPKRQPPSAERKDMSQAGRIDQRDVAYGELRRLIDLDHC